MGTRMIITVTPAPGLDRTYTAREYLEGRVNRAQTSTVEASGKGVNVSRALAAAGSPTVAVLPLGGPEGRHLAELLVADEVPFLAVDSPVATRTNTTLAVSGRSTTKMNAPSPALPQQVWADLRRLVEDLLQQYPGAWVLCSGSVPVGAEALPAELIELARRNGARSAVDSSGAALTAALAAKPDLIAPNHLELAEMVGVDPHTLDPDGARRGEYRHLGRTGGRLGRRVGPANRGSGARDPWLQRGGVRRRLGQLACARPPDRAGQHRRGGRRPAGRVLVRRGFVEPGAPRGPRRGVGHGGGLGDRGLRHGQHVGGRRGRRRRRCCTHHKTFLNRPNGMEAHV